jgi:hypothetical protein
MDMHFRLHKDRYVISCMMDPIHTSLFLFFCLPYESVVTSVLLYKQNETYEPADTVNETCFQIIQLQAKAIFFIPECN